RKMIATLETIYRVEQSPADWLDGVLGQFRQLVDGRGWCGYFVDASGEEFRDWGYRACGRFRKGAAAFNRWREQTPTAVKRFIHLHAPCNYGSQISPPPALMAGLGGTWEHHGEAEMFGLNALDAAGRGCTFAAALQ